MKLKQENVEKISNRLFHWGFDIWEQNQNDWSKKQLVEFESTWSILKKLIKENEKQQEALDYVKNWLTDTIEEGSSDSIEEDSANLLHNVKTILNDTKN